MAPVRTTGAVVAAISISMAVLSYFLCNYKSKKEKTHSSLPKKKRPRNGLIDVVGNTPLIRINSLSEATGCEVSSFFFLYYHQDVVFCFIFWYGFPIISILFFYIICGAFCINITNSCPSYGLFLFLMVLVLSLIHNSRSHGAANASVYINWL